MAHQHCSHTSTILPELTQTRYAQQCIQTSPVTTDSHCLSGAGLLPGKSFHQFWSLPAKAENLQQVKWLCSEAERTERQLFLPPKLCGLKFKILNIINHYFIINICWQNLVLFTRCLHVHRTALTYYETRGKCFMSDYFYRPVIGLCSTQSSQLRK